MAVARMTGRGFTIFPEEKWVKRIPFFILAYTMAMLLLGSAITGSSTLVQHLYVYSFGIGEILLTLLFLILWRKSQIKILKIDGNTDNLKK